MRHTSLGQCLSADNLRELIKFAYDEKIVLMADEVYQVGSVLKRKRPACARITSWESRWCGGVTELGKQVSVQCSSHARAETAMYFVFWGFSSQLEPLLLGPGLQENVYQDERPFVSAKKVMWEMGEPYRSHVELLSFHTVSKVGGVHVKQKTGAGPG